MEYWSVEKKVSALHPVLQYSLTPILQAYCFMLIAKPSEASALFSISPALSHQPGPMSAGFCQDDCRFDQAMGSEP